MTKKQLSQLFLIQTLPVNQQIWVLCVCYFFVLELVMYIFFFLFSPESKTFVVAQGTLNCLIVLLLEMTI